MSETNVKEDPCSGDKNFFVKVVGFKVILLLDRIYIFSKTSLRIKLTEYNELNKTLLTRGSFVGHDRIAVTIYHFIENEKQGLRLLST